MILDGVLGVLASFDGFADLVNGWVCLGGKGDSNRPIIRPLASS